MLATGSDPHAAEALQATVMAGIAVVLLVGVVFVRLFTRIGQPAVVGEILAGVALGPSLLGLLPGDLPELLFPQDARPFLATIAQVGLLLFMFIVGWELDFSVLRSGRGSVALVAIGSIALPFLFGLGVAMCLYQRHATVDGEPVPYGAFLLFLGVSMSVTAFPVLARILSDKGLVSTRAGMLALTSAALGDVLAWCLLAGVVAVVSASGPGGVVTMLGWSVGYVCVMALLVRRLLAWGTRRLAHRRPELLAGLAMAGLLLSAWTTARIGIHPIFGAFAFGLAMPREPRVVLEEAVLNPLHHAGRLLLPVYFVVTGLSVNIAVLSGTAWVEVGLIVAAACVGKLLGAMIPARCSGMAWRESLDVGVLMNTRGLTEIVILNVGLSMQVLDTQLFTELVVMALFTTVMTGWLLPRTGPGAEPDPGRRARRVKPDRGRARPHGTDDRLIDAARPDV